MNTINFNKVIAYSRSICTSSSMGLCATYVKKAFERGGCKYISGDGWNNQRWCMENNFKLIGDFVPIDKNPRPHNGMPIQFPNGYVQQVGDICLIKHGQYGHICYAMGSNINDWVSDYFQRPPGQLVGTGPYCYSGDIERVQFWRHSSVLNNVPTIESMEQDIYIASNKNTTSNISGISNSVKRLADSGVKKENVLKQDIARKQEFESLTSSMASKAPNMGRDILLTSELYDANILKGNQESKKERV